jgi:outer membrane protein TolC
MKTRAALAGLLLALLANAAARAGDDPGPLDLEACLAFTYDHNGELRSAHTVEAMRAERVRQAGAGFLPSVGFDAFATWYDAKPEQEVTIPGDVSRVLHTHDRVTGEPRPIAADRLAGITVESTPQDPHAFKLSVTQPVFTSGKLTNTLQLHREGRDLAALEADKVRRQVGFAVVRSFYATLAAEEVLAVREDAVRLSDAVRDDVRSRAARETASRLQLAQAEAEHAQAELPRLQAQYDLDDSLRLLKHRMGWEPGRPLAISGVLAFAPARPDVAALTREALANRPDLRLLDGERRVRERELRAAWLANTPSVYLSGNYEFYQTQRLDLPENVLYGGVVLSWPIFDGGAQLPKVRQARLALEELETRRATLAAGVTFDVERAVAEIALAEQRYLVQERVVETVHAAVRAAETGEAVGKVAAPGLARERIALADARAARAALMRDHVLAKARLAELVGHQPGPP